MPDALSTHARTSRNVYNRYIHACKSARVMPEVTTRASKRTDNDSSQVGAYCAGYGDCRVSVIHADWIDASISARVMPDALSIHARIIHFETCKIDICL